MTETQRRIRAYKKALPQLRERVIAVALLLAMSASMLGTASFAWITLSTAPEVSGMATTVAANGNLEIALAQGESMKNGIPVAAKEPEEAAVGDSSLAQGIAKSNVTWGNLVNLSEEHYGVDDIALRPALLNNTNRNKYPLYGAKYGSDGRVENTTQRYEYTSYQLIDEEHNVWSFAAGDKAQYGVRAISSVGYDTSVGNAILDEFVINATQAYGNVATEYQRMVNPNVLNPLILTSGRTCIAALEGLVGVFAQDKINSMSVSMIGNLAPSDDWVDKKMNCSMYIYDVYEMLLQMKKILEYEGEGLRQLANSQVYSQTAVVNTIASVDELLAKSENDLKNLGITLVSFAEFKSNYNTILSSINTLVTNTLIKDVVIGELVGIEAFSQANNPSLPEIHYEDISGSVNKLFDMNKTTIGGTKITGLSGSTALDILNKDDNPVVIGGGVLSAFEKRALADSTQRLNQRAAVAVKVKMLGDKTVKGVVTTESFQYSHVDGDKTYLTDMEKTDAGGVAGAGEAVAEDTFGMAIDLWARTNYPNAVLTLEGNVLTQPVQAQDASGNYLYTLTVEELVYELYSASQNSGPYYYVSNGTEVPQEDLNAGSLSPVETTVVIGYEGENRIWSEEALQNMAEKGYLAEDSTSQGSGSCFVFYADSKSEQQKLLEMLQSFTIAFIDGNGGRLGTAKLNTEKKFENQGKVTVPLEIVSGVPYEEMLDSGEIITKMGIMNLSQNQATRITAIVYLDGTNLQNQNVLADNEMNGQLNIQFGTNTVLMPPSNEELQQQYRTITLSAQSEDGQRWPEANQITYAHYDPNGHQVTVNLNVDGMQPGKISGFFVRRISATQGSRLATVDFTPVATVAEDGSAIWTATFNLKDPGTYILSDLLVDGMQYSLDKDSQTGNHLTVFIPGLALGAVTLDTTDSVIRTANSSYTIPVTAQILSEVGTPQNVTVHLYEKGDESNQVIARLSNVGNSSWQGDVVFSRSGTYILDSVTVDGTSLDITSKREITFYMGMRCEVYNARVDRQESFIYEGQPVQVPVTVKIWDDTPSEVKNLSGVTLRYKLGNSQTVGTEATMTWNSAGYYTGTLNLTSPGTYSFQYLTMNLGNSSGIIGSADYSPTFRLNPKNPPAYVSGSANADATQLAIDPSIPVTMRVQVSDAQTATIYAEMTKGNEVRYISKDNPVDDIFTFDLSGLSGGTWTLTNLYAQGISYLDENNQIVSYAVTDTFNADTIAAGNAYLLSDVDHITTRIVTKDDIQVTATLNDADRVYEGVFMQEQYPAITVSVTDKSGNAIEGVQLAGGTWNVTYTGGQEEHGGYTGTYGAGSYAVPIDGAGAAKFVDGSDVADDLRTAGTYTSSLALKLTAENGIANYPAVSGPGFTITSTLPKVTVKAVSPTGTFSVNSHASANTGGGFTELSGVSNFYTDYSATVYLRYTGATFGTWRNYAEPSVTLELSEVAHDFTTASLTVGNNRDAQHAKTFTFSPGKTQVTSEIGYAQDASFTDANPPLFPAGKQTVTSITMVYNTITFEVPLVHDVIINQPSAPYYVDFASNSTTGVALNSVPSRIVATPNADGDFQITLPAAQNWTTPGERRTGDGWQVKSETTDYVYRTWNESSGCGGSTTYYVGYDRYTLIEESLGTVTTWTNNYKLTGWKIGSTTYAPGETVTLSSNQTVTAVVSAVVTNEVTTSTNLRRTNVTYKETMAQTETKDSKYTINIGTGKTAPTNIVNQVETIS